MITKQIDLVEKVDNGDGTRSCVAEINVFVDGVFKWQDSRSRFTFADTMTDQEIIDSLWLNEYSRYA